MRANAMKESAVAAEAITETATVLIDPVTVNRTAEVPEAASVPRPPSQYRPSPPDRRRRLRRIAEGHVAEATAAAEEVMQRGPELQTDFGSRAPSSNDFKVVLDRVTKVQTTLAAVRTLLGFLEENEDIALSDLVMLLEHAHRLYDANATIDPALAQHYRALETFFRFRGEAISEGRAQARALAEARTPTVPA